MEDVERLVKLETMLDHHIRQQTDFISEQRKNNEEARESRHESANRQHTMSQQLTKLDVIVCGDGENGGGLIGDMREIRLTLSGLGWRVLATAGTVLAGIGTISAWLMSQFGVHLAKGH